MNEHYIDFLEFLKKRIIEPLPGMAAHVVMAVTKDGKFFRKFEPDVKPYESAVLVLLTIKDNLLQVLLTLRSSHLNNHGGQICCPGGRKEDNETAIDTALRETYEELGIIYDRIKIIGTLSELYVPPSNNLITPIVGFIDSLDDLNINEKEVDEAFTVPISFLADEKNVKSSLWKIGKDKVEVTVPHWNIGKRTPLWGATAMILNELIFLYKEFKSGM